MRFEVHENWNRYYDPVPGVYLQPEPLLREDTGYYSAVAKAYGTQPLAYAYAFNNPLFYVDPDGLGPKKGPGVGGAANTDYEKFTPTTLQECLELAARGLKELEDFYDGEYNRRLDELNKASQAPGCNQADILAQLKDLEDQMNQKQKSLKARAKWARANCEKAFPKK